MELNLFNYQATLESSSYSVDSDNVWVLPTSEGMDQIYLEASEDFANIEASSYISDAYLARVAITESYERYETLKEGAIASMFFKIRDAIVRLWKKVKAWFQKVWENIKIFFMSGDKFIKEYENIIKSKPTKDFTFTTYEFKVSAGEAFAKKITDKCQSEHDSISKYVGAPEEAEKRFKKDDIDDIKDKVLKDLKVNEASEIKEEIRKAYGVDDNKVDVNGFDKGMSRDEMIKFLKKGKDITKEHEGKMRTMDKDFRTLISNLDSAEKKLNEKETNKNAKLAAAVKRASNFATEVSSWGQSAYSAQIEIRKLIYFESLRILKKFAVHKTLEKITKNSADFGLFGDFSL